MAAVRTAASQLEQPQAAVAELKTQLPGEPVAVLVFHSSGYPAEELAQELAQAFPGARTLGCSTMGELGGSELRRGSLSAMAFYPPLRLAVTAVSQGEDFHFSEGRSLLQGLAQELGLELAELSAERCVLMTLTDGLSGTEERLVASLALAAPGLPLVGGSAADDLQMQGTSAILDGRSLPSTSLVVLLEPGVEHRVFAVHHFEPTERRVVVTRTGSSPRLVHELDGRPAAEVYAELAGVDLQALEADPLLPSRRELCFGIRVGTEYRMRSAFSVTPEGALALRGSVEVGEVLRVMRGSQLVERTRAGLSRALGGLEAEGLLLFNCGGRLLEAEAHGLLAELGDAMAPAPAAGFSTYGEQFGPLLVNHTLTGIAFGG